MTIITRLDNHSRNMLVEKMLAAIEEVVEEFGLTVQADGYRYDASGTHFTPKFNVATVVNGEAMTRERMDFENCCGFYGLKKEDFGKTFISNGETYRLSGLKPSAPKYPILGTRVRDGKTYKFTPHVTAKIRSSA